MSFQRPDERAAQSKIDSAKNVKSFLDKGVKTAIGAGAASLGAGIASRVLPLLSEYIPTELAMKGISKVSPKLGEFLKNGQKMGLDVKEGMNFIKEKMQPKQEAPKDDRNVIQQYSPELHQFVDQEIKNGRSVLEAGALAQNDKRFVKIIDKLSKDHKAPWSNILESVFGGNQQGSSQEQSIQQPKGNGSNDQSLLNSFNDLLKL